MERLRNRRPDGLSISVIRAWGLVFLLIGLVGRLLWQSDLLGFGKLGMEERVAAMEANPDLLSLMIIARVLQAVEACAIPIFAFLLAEGFYRTKDLKK